MSIKLTRILTENSPVDVKNVNTKKWKKKKIKEIEK